VPNCCLEPLYRNASSASPTSVPFHSSNDVPSQEEFQNSNQRKSKVGTHSPTSRPMELPPPTYDEVVSSADSSPHLERSRSSAVSEHEYQSIRESATDSHVYEEIPESNVSAFLFTYFNYVRTYINTLRPVGGTSDVTFPLLSTCGGKFPIWCQFTVCSCNLCHNWWVAFVVY